MENRKEFQNLLFNSCIADFDSKDQAKKIISKINEWIISNTPQSLFRYRTCEEYCFTSLENDQIWGSTVHHFNDPFEWLPFCDMNKVQEFINKSYDPERIIPAIKNLDKNNLPKELQAMIEPELLEKIFEFWEKKENLEIFKNAMPKGKSIMTDLFVENYEKYITVFFQTIFYWAMLKNIACFSEDNLSTLMWGHYAQKHQGFVGEYDFKSIQGQCVAACENKFTCQNFTLNLPLAPVIYTEKRFDAHLLFLNIATTDWRNKYNLPVTIQNYDTLLMTKSLLTKCNLWEYEKEWRLFSKIHKTEQEFDIKEHKCITTVKPKAVYIGVKATKETKERLQQICKSKNIACFQMQQSYLSDEFCLKYVEC